ncbi:MAG: DUF1844 domain-containing protein [Planctomycetota bacterium]
MNQPVPPDPSLRVIVSTFATQAAVALGQIANPATNQTEIDLGRAKFNIDLVQVLKEKTAANATEEESKYTDDCLYQLRMLFIDKSAKK